MLELIVDKQRLDEVTSGSKFEMSGALHRSIGKMDKHLCFKT